MITVIALTGLSMRIWAQTDQGQIAGNIVDPNGAMIANASVRATNESTGSVYETASNSGGGYRLPAVAVGTYTVRVKASGFKELDKKEVVVQIGTTTALDFTLAIGNVSETVTVDASATAVESQSSDVGGVVSEKQIEELPMALSGLGQFRAPENFVFLLPGTVGPGTAGGAQGSGPAQAAGIYLDKIGGNSIFNGLKRMDDPTYSALQPNPALYDQNYAVNRNGGPFTFGNMQRNEGEVRNFGFLNEDLVLMKNIPIRGDYSSFQLKAEFLNAFNRHNFNSPDPNPYDNDYGVPLSVVGGSTDSQRRIQLTGRFMF
jgi:hypothetical protein